MIERPKTLPRKVVRSLARAAIATAMLLAPQVLPDSAAVQAATNHQVEQTVSTPRQRLIRALRNSYPRLNSSMSVGFNEGGSTCKLSIGSGVYKEIDISGVNNFSNTGNPTNIYTNCRDQFLGDIDELGKHQVKAVRIWPELSQFAYDPASKTYGHLNSNISNLDEILAEYAKNNIKVYMTLNQMPVCSTYTTGILDLIFNPNLINNPTLQTQYNASLKEFLARYKNNAAVDSYDLVNEAAYLVRGKGQVCNYQGSPIPPIVFDSPDLAQTKSFLTAMYKAAKAADPNHPFTFSFGDPYDRTTQTSYRDFFRGIVDFYDVHPYSFASGTNPAVQPSDLYNQLPSYNRPLRHGEIGIADNPNVVDSQGNSCYGDPNNPDSWMWDPMNQECQDIFLNNAQQWVATAKARGVQRIFFHAWPVSRRYGQRNYDPNTRNIVTGYSWTEAGQYILNLQTAR